MAGFKVVIGGKQGKCLQKEIAEPEANVFLGKRIGDRIAGDSIGFAGYEFEISGGSDYAGFPMRKDIPGVGRKRILAVQGTGLKKKAKGIRQRKTVCGNTIHPNISQINLKITAEGREPLPFPVKEGEKEEKKEVAPKPEPKKEEKPAEKPKEEKKEAAPKPEPKKEEKPAEKPKEEKKEAAPQPEPKKEEPKTPK